MAEDKIQLSCVSDIWVTVLRLHVKLSSQTKAPLFDIFPSLKEEDDREAFGVLEDIVGCG